MTTYTATLENGKKMKAEKRGERFYYRNSLGRMIVVSKNKITLI